MTTSWLAIQAPATFFRVRVARFTPLSRASSKLFLEEEMISVTRATDDMFGSLSPVISSLLQSASPVATMHANGSPAFQSYDSAGSGVAGLVRRSLRRHHRRHRFISEPGRAVDDGVCLGSRYVANSHRAARARTGEFCRRGASRTLSRVP